MHSEAEKNSTNRPLGANPKELLPKGFVLNDKWEILRHIATGVKGDVYLARQQNLQRQVAVKIISPDFVKTFDDDSKLMESEKNKYRREAVTMAKVHHPNILQVLDNGTIYMDGEDLDYLVMEYVPGQTLRVTIPDEGFCGHRLGLIAWLNDYFIPILKGIEAFHSAGVIHRDLNPENILLAGVTPKITDFGLVRGETCEKDASSRYCTLGCINYMPREQYENATAANKRSDIYALGKILFEAIRGTITDKDDVLFKEVSLNPEDHPAYNEPFYRALSKLIQQATKEKNQDRIKSVSDFREQLEEIIQAVSNPQAVKKEKSPLRYLLVGVFALLVLGLGVFLLMPSSKDNTQVIVHDGVEKILPDIYDDGKGGIFAMVADGPAVWSDGPGTEKRTKEVEAFYIRKSLVNNAQYLSFLNSHCDQIRVKDNEVYKNNILILKIGLVDEDYEPIIYENGKFHISKPSYANISVTNVTVEGAEAFAIDNQQELPTLAQWQRARNVGTIPLAPKDKEQKAYKEWIYDLGENQEKIFLQYPPDKASPNNGTSNENGKANGKTTGENSEELDSAGKNGQKAKDKSLNNQGENQVKENSTLPEKAKEIIELPKYTPRLGFRTIKGLDKQ